MTPHEKLVLIRQCCEHSDKYFPGNKSNFWLMIRKLLRERTDYDLVDPRQTITRWVETSIDKLVENEMRSSTQIERNAFTVAVEQYASRWQAVADEINESVRVHQQRAAETMEVARLASSLVIDVDDEPIPGVNAPSSSATDVTGPGTPSVEMEEGWGWEMGDGAGVVKGKGGGKKEKGSRCATKVWNSICP